MSKQGRALRGIVYQNSKGLWFAVFLDHYLMTHSETLPGLLEEIPQLLACHCRGAWEEGVKPFEGLREAPKRYWEMWNSASDEVVLEDASHLAVPVQMRQIAA